LEFRWNRWNVEHIARHGVDPEAAEQVVRAAERPYPRAIGDDKRLVWGRDRGGQLLQVIFVFDDDGTVFIVHARPLTDTEKRRYRRARR
jgi:uncharacterized DUF497 family protein